MKGEFELSRRIPRLAEKVGQCNERELLAMTHGDALLKGYHLNAKTSREILMKSLTFI